MRKALIFMLLAFASLSGHAQVNPKAGYIITNENDTVYGTIDYRTNMRNAEVCNFKAEGSASYKEYRPGDISGYRLSENGIYYVTRTFPIGGEEKTVFAEFMIQGGISLYHYQEYSTDYYFLVDADGQIAPIRETHNLYLATEDRRQAQQEKMLRASQMLMQSQKAQRQLWEMSEVKPKELTRLTREYNMEYCTEAGECVTFQYDSKVTTSMNVRLRVEAGLGLLRMVMTPHETVEDMDLTGTAPVVGVGADILFPRFSKSLVVQAMLYYSPNKADGQSTAYGLAQSRKMEFHDLSLQLGGLYRFMPERRFTPIVRGGLSLNYLFGYKTENMNGYYGNSAKFIGTNTVSAGFYVGAGAEVGVGTHRVALTANYIYRNFVHFDFNAPLFVFNLGFVL